MLTGCVGAEAGTVLTTRVHQQSLPTPQAYKQVQLTAGSVTHTSLPKPSVAAVPGEMGGSPWVTRW